MIQSVKLRKMNADEYILWMERSISGYAESLIASGQCSEPDAMIRAESDFTGKLVNGLSTRDHHILVAENLDGIAVGMIWYETTNPKWAFIADIAVYAEYRRMGYGSAILAELEHILKSAEIPAVILHVFEQNITAIRLYEKCGFTIAKAGNADVGSLYMKKQF